MNRAKQLLDKFSGSELAVGGHVFFTDASISEEMACWGYDFIWIDAEHGPFDKEKILQSIVAANNAGAAAIVRVTVNDPDVYKRQHPAYIHPHYSERYRFSFCAREPTVSSSDFLPAK